MGNYTLALDQLLFCVNHGQPRAEFYYHLGMVFVEKGEVLQAKQALRKALEMSQDFEGASQARSTLTGLG